MNLKYKFLLITIFTLYVSNFTEAKKISSKAISPDLFGIFFEDINYAADGGLYAELIQNRSFEYTPSDKQGWNSFTAWDYTAKGYAYGTTDVETKEPLNKNNPHYVVINVENEGSEGIGLINSGFDGIVIKSGENYNLSIFIRLLSENPVPVQIKILNKKGEQIGETTISPDSKEWKKYTAVITASQNCDSASVSVIARAKGKIAIDMVSLFPQNTFKRRTNGLRADLAQTIADLQPKFIRFPGGCLVHGDGIGNMYRWENTIGPIEQRLPQKNIWGYHQTAGLGYYEFFQFCEDIGAKPLPVVPAGVSCQNSGGTWRIGGTGQKGIPQVEMPDYIQEVLNLIEWANGSATSTWGAKRAAAGHPGSFHLQYIGIGNEDKITPEFSDRFRQIYDAVKAKYPEITVIGTVGPSPDGEDFEKGWKLANELKIPIVDEHYYMKPEWFLANQKRYDNYNRKESKVYLGEYASHGNTLYNALAEAAYMTSLERNGDVVKLSSYAPLLAKKGHTQWNPDMIYFSNTEIYKTANYYVQQLFSVNSGDIYNSEIIDSKNEDAISSSCVVNSKNKDIYLKIVNTGKTTKSVNINLSSFPGIHQEAEITVLSGAPDMKNSLANPVRLVPVQSKMQIKKKFIYTTPAMSLTIIKLKR